MGKYKRMSAKVGKSLLDFATEIESRRIVCEKRKQVGTLLISRNSQHSGLSEVWNGYYTLNER